jgi:soluble lytic murein transglycosylase-like protein
VSTVKKVATPAILSLSFALRLIWGGTALAEPQPPTRPPQQQDAAADSSSAEAPTASAAGTVVDVYGLIVEAARRWNLDERVLLRIAWCESRFDPNASGRGGTAGVFQFIPRTWAWVSEAAGFGGASPFDPLANVESAAWLFAHQGPRHWTCT